MALRSVDLLLEVMGRIESTQCLWTRKPQLREFTAQYSGSGGSPDDCFALRNDAKLTLRELTVDRHCACVRVLCVAASSGFVGSGAL
ncbi:hypothetical protein TcBrA4_0052920 [Trypanosoma cruzi]|nr:hypothetical protein TcBrA4_0052920 [Trypanosoma cruzi]